MRMTGFPALLVECLCSQWAIWHGLVNRSRIAAKLTRDGRLVALQQMGNLRDGFALSKKKEYLFSLKWCKMCVVAGLGTIDPSGTANIPDSSAASGAAQSSTFNMTDSMSQQAGSATFNVDGSADFTNADMSYAGHMFSDGSPLNSLNIPDGHIDFANGTGTIYDNLNNAIFTIDGNTIYDANHQVAYTMQDGTLFDKMNQVVGTLHKA